MALTAKVLPNPFATNEETEDGSTLSFADIEARDNETGSVMSRATVALHRDAEGHKLLGLHISVRPAADDSRFGFSPSKEVSFDGALALAILRACRAAGRVVSLGGDADLADLAITISTDTDD